MLRVYGPNGIELTANAVGFYSGYRTVSSGNTDTITAALLAANTSLLWLWNSASGAAKTGTVPASIGSLKVIKVIDIQGDAYANPITFAVTGGGTVAGLATVNANQGQITLTDTPLGWTSGT